MVAVANNFGGFYQSWVYFNEAKRWGAQIQLPCINTGRYLNSVKDKIITIGLVHISGLEAGFANYIINERTENGLYTSLEDFIQRTGAGLEQVVLLIRTGAFRFTGFTKQQLLWHAHMLMGKVKKEPAPVLFNQNARNFELPVLVHEPLEDAYDEIELLDFPVSLSYFDMLKTGFRGEINASALKHITGKTVRMMGALVTIKYVRTIKSDIMQFVTFVDSEGEFFDAVLFPDVLKNNPPRGRGVYLLLGKVVDDFGYPSLEVTRMAKMPPKNDPRYK
jgi:DNA polymerase III alpha subunit